MSDILFVCNAGQEAAGCIDRIQVSVPFVRQATDKAGNPLFNQMRQPIIVPDSNAAWNWVRQLPFPFPPGAHFTGYIRNPMTPPDHGPPIVLIHHIKEPAVSERFVNAGQPDATPVGDSAEILPPPVTDPNKKNWGGPDGQLQRADPWEDIDRSGLPKNADTMMGEVDAQGGTFADVSPFDDQERQRSLERREAPPKPKLTKEVVHGFAVQWYTKIDPQTRKPVWTIDPRVAYQQTYDRLKATKTYDLSA